MRVSASNNPDLDILIQLVPHSFNRVQAASYSKEYIFEMADVKASQINAQMAALHDSLSSKFGSRLLGMFVTRENSINSLVVVLRTPLKVVF